MAKKTKYSSERLNLFIPTEIAMKLNKYCLSVANDREKMPWGLKSAIALKALETWLDTNKNDVHAWEKK